MGIQDNIKRLREKHNLTQDELAEIAGVSAKAVSTWETGRNEPRMGAIQRMADHFGILKSAIIEDNPSSNYIGVKYDNIIPITTRKIPLLGEIACGQPIYAAEDLESYVEVGTDVHADFALRAKGDSMINARIQDGDIVFVRAQPDVENGQIAAVIIDDEATLKRVYKQVDSISLNAENPAYNPLICRNGDGKNVRILGLAIAFQSGIR